MAQEKDFIYLDTADFSATVCDREGTVLYQNEKAVLRDGNVTGGNLYDCHGDKASMMIRKMISEGSSNTYQIIRHGRHKLIHQTPWYDGDGKVAGLIELAIDLPEDLQVFDRGYN